MTEKTHFQGMVSELINVLGVRLVAYIGNTDNAVDVVTWENGPHVPSPSVVMRLTFASDCVNLILNDDSPGVVRAWFQGMNPYLADIAPATVLREGNPSNAYSAAIAFALEG